MKQSDKMKLAFRGIPIVSNYELPVSEQLFRKTLHWSIQEALITRVNTILQCFLSADLKF